MVSRSKPSNTTLQLSENLLSKWWEHRSTRFGENAGRSLLSCKCALDHIVLCVRDVAALRRFYHPSRYAFRQSGYFNPTFVQDAA